MRPWLYRCVLPLVLAASAVGCGSSSHDVVVPAAGLEQYDSTATLLRGPWLSPAGPGAITVSWSTDEPARSRVEYGLDASLGSEAQGTVAQPPSEGPGEAATTGWQHTVTLDGLAADTVYHYRIVSLALPSATATLRAPATAGGELTFALMGDVRTDDDAHQAVIDAVRATEPAFVVNTGDLTAAGGVEDVWNTFFGIEHALLASTAFLPVYGNHEDILGRTLFDTYFPAPPGARSPRTYSVDWGGVHVAVLDRYQSLLADEVAWLDADLAAPAARAARLRVVALHPPLYTFANHAPDLEARAALWPLLKLHDVALVVSGHNHLYERFFVDGVQSVVTGGGGAPRYPSDSNVIADEVPLARVASSQYHFISVTADPAGFRFEVRPVPADELLDCFVLDPQRPGVELACE